VQYEEPERWPEHAFNLFIEKQRTVWTVKAWLAKLV
jgi:hypothetical protein